MSLGDTLGYYLLGNPVSQAVLSTASQALKGSNIAPQPPVAMVPPPPPPPVLEIKSLYEMAGRSSNIIRLAGFCGATAVFMGALGHNISSIVDSKERLESKAIFDTANRFHFLHSCAMLAIPLAQRPMLTGTLMAAGLVLFSGPMYYRALTGDKGFVRVATCGGFCLIAAWLTLIF